MSLVAALSNVRLWNKTDCVEYLHAAQHSLLACLHFIQASQHSVEAHKLTVLDDPVTDYTAGFSAQPRQGDNYKMNTNANSKLLASILADARIGTFTGLVTTKVGKTVKGVTYGNDRVHTVIFTGFNYGRLVMRSLAQLGAIETETVIAKAAKRGHTITEADVEQAREELRESFQKSVAGENESTTSHVFDPLVVDGETVTGARVYKCVAETHDENGEVRECRCRTCTGDEKAPLSGTIYLTGLRIHSTVLEASVNGPIPPVKSAPKTIAKDTMRDILPIGRFVQYRLEPGTDFILRAGGTAVAEATQKGFVVTDEIVDVLQRAA